MIQHNMFQYGDNPINRRRKQTNLVGDNLLFSNLNTPSFNQSASAFSLVELSIVLIIIGLLISAVIGGRALIDEAKIITIRNEFEEIKFALSQYENTGRSFIDIHNYLCKTSIWEEMKDLGYIDKSRYIRQGWGTFKSKIKGKTNHYNLWSNRQCWSPNTWSRTAKTYVHYGVMGEGTTDEKLLDPKFCKKLVQKFRSYYGGDIGADMEDRNASKNSKYIFSCWCGNNAGLYGDECQYAMNDKSYGAFLEIVIIDF